MQKIGYLYPDIDIQLKEVNHQSFTKLRLEEIDMTIVTTRQNSEDLIAIKIYEDDVTSIDQA